MNQKIIESLNFTRNSDARFFGTTWGAYEFKISSKVLFCNHHAQDLSSFVCHPDDFSIIDQNTSRLFRLPDGQSYELSVVDLLHASDDVLNSRIGVAALFVAFLRSFKIPFGSFTQFKELFAKFQFASKLNDSFKESKVQSNSISLPDTFEDSHTYSIYFTCNDSFDISGNNDAHDWPDLLRSDEEDIPSSSDFDSKFVSVRTFSIRQGTSKSFRQGTSKSFGISVHTYRHEQSQDMEIQYFLRDNGSIALMATLNDRHCPLSLTSRGSGQTPPFLVREPDGSYTLIFDDAHKKSCDNNDRLIHLVTKGLYLYNAAKIMRMTATI